MTTTSRQPTQLRLLDLPSLAGRSGTFSPNRALPLHRWYPYLEGFSEGFVLALLDEFADDGTTVHDPFAGTGTTLLVSALTGRSGTYCEVNPFMRLVVESKTNVARTVAPYTGDLADYFEMLTRRARSAIPSDEDAVGELALAFGSRNYFEASRLREVVALRRSIADLEPSLPGFRVLARLALASIVVDSSQLVRSGDVRYRKESEMDRRFESPLRAFSAKAHDIVSDLADFPTDAMAPVELLSDSALDEPGSVGITDVVITSPPYLNGTNYFRNTKLELWAAGLLATESELSGLRSQAVAAGINNVSKRGREPSSIDYVDSVAEQLDAVAYDRRIPELVRRYFSDAMTWLGNVHTLLRPGGRALVDIGDSQFAGIRVKTDELLERVGEDVGLEVQERRVLRKRRSNDGSPLEQVLLVFTRPTDATYLGPTRESIRVAAQRFEVQQPHQRKPLSARNWGHGWHSLCSYQGKLKPAIAHVLVREFTAPGEVVLDPMSGAGTIPLEACLQGRVGLGNDLQELAFILTRAKVEFGEQDDAHAVADALIEWVHDRGGEQDPERYRTFGMNGHLGDYFHVDTFREILAAREYMAQHPVDSWARALVYASLLHILHGNRPYALSRRSHPVTPFKPSGPVEYRELASRLRSKVERSLNQAWPGAAVAGEAWNMDMFNLSLPIEVDAVITSPPFAGSTRFFVANWMRLWMAGWEPEDFETRRADFLEHRQKDELGIYTDFFERCAHWLKPSGRLVMHVGKNGKWNMADELIPRAAEWFDLVHRFDESVVGREKFGIRDQGATTSHQYLVFIRN
jgi:hypothetical protein